eukprot:584124-Rhodomonas_salina.1
METVCLLQLLWHEPPKSRLSITLICLRAHYAMSGTDLAYGVTSGSQLLPSTAHQLHGGRGTLLDP